MAHNMENVEEFLRMRKADLQRTDCSIIIAGFFFFLKRDDVCFIVIHVLMLVAQYIKVRRH